MSQNAHPMSPADALKTRCTTVTQTRQQDALNLVRPHHLGLNRALYTVPRFAIRNLFVRYQFVPQVTVTFNRFQEHTHHFNPEEISNRGFNPHPRIINVCSPGSFIVRVSQ